MLKKILLALFVTGYMTLPSSVSALTLNSNRIIVASSPTPLAQPTLSVGRLTVFSSPTPTTVPINTLPLRKLQVKESSPTPTSTFRKINSINSGDIKLTSTPTGILGEPPVPTPSAKPQTNFSSIISAAKSLGTITQSETASDAGAPIYRFKIQEKLKLFGVIPVAGNSIFEVDQNKHIIRKANRPWWVFLTAKQNWADVFSQLGPNITVSDVSWDNKSYHAGDIANIHFKIKNTGTELYMGMIDIAWRKGEAPIGYIKNHLLYIYPGESKDFHEFQPWTYECEKPIFIELDETNKVKETDKKDNVWQGVSTCAPTSGPDLAVTDFTFENSLYPFNEKIVGAKNKFRYTLKNLGDQPSTKTRVLIRTTGGQYLALNDIPVLIPGFNQTTAEVSYTPNDCSPIEFLIDTENKNTETNEDNNYVREPAEVTDHCNKRADVFFTTVYWTITDSSGMSSRDPHYAGEPMLFSASMVNSQDNQDWGCANNLKIGVFENGTQVNTFDMGNLGIGAKCPNGGGYTGESWDHPSTTKTQKFYYAAKCGVTLKLVLDPTNTVYETNKTNNTWERKIECK